MLNFPYSIPGTFFELIGRRLDRFKMNYDRVFTTKVKKEEVMSKKTGRKPVGKGKKKKHRPHPSQRPAAPAPGQKASEGSAGAEGGNHGQQAGTKEPEV